MGDDEDAPRRAPRPPLWMPRDPRIPCQTFGKFPDTTGPYLEHTCPRDRWPIRTPEQVEQDRIEREEGGGGKKKSSGLGALMLGDTQFKRFNVPAKTKAPPEKEDERDVWLLKQMHYVMNYADTYLELSASKLFAVEYFDRGVSLGCILIYCICCGLLYQVVDERRAKYLINLGDGYAWPYNFFWWNALQFLNIGLILHCFGVLQFLIVPPVRRIYYILFSFAFAFMCCTYLQKNGCWALCPIIMWTTIIVTLITAGRPSFMNRMGDPLADVLFFTLFILMTIQAICAKDDEFGKVILLILVAFAYAGPIGYWGWFNWRILIFTVCMYFAIPIMEPILSNKTGGYTPKTLLEYFQRDYQKIFPYVQALPVSWGCPLKDCEPGLYLLFAGGKWGLWGSEEEEEPKGWFQWGDFDFGIELPPSFDDFLFWAFVILMVIFDFYSLHVMEVVKEVEVIPGPCTPYDLGVTKKFETIC